MINGLKTEIKKVKENKCKLCGWIGRTEIHHIIPRKEQGSEDSENLIELCPNHHAEASEDELLFANKFNLIGKKKSNEELDALQEYSHLFARRCEINRMNALQEIYKFDKFDALAYLMGTTRNYIEETYGVSE